VSYRSEDPTKKMKKKKKPRCADCKSMERGLFTVARWIGPPKGKAKKDPKTGKTIPNPIPGEVKETVTLCTKCRKEWAAFIR